MKLKVYNIPGSEMARVGWRFACRTTDATALADIRADYFACRAFDGSSPLWQSFAVTRADDGFNCWVAVTSDKAVPRVGRAGKPQPRNPQL